MKRLDDTNIEIVRKLQDGRKPFSQIASELNITENTVRARVNKMMDDGILKIQGLVDPQMMPDVQIVFVGFRFKTRDLETKARDLLKLKGVQFATVVTGRYDIISEVMLSESQDFTLLDFFKKELVKISDISEVETYVVYQSHNLNVPYIL
ncbi:MAG: Lrp/AsnC family transcriptional regulator [Sphaerochaetaceae bacterium]|jgi:Lrp/AsnC family transcriptional regulator for asnA, asnC and gidA|nr:Lrp/AsnC family transcriptional regulator [Sphaerochaetaceae bacterium]MDD3162828.1 Lrp/AsnC family transcriptional regulator [Sphaerochaetaceae bacterium]MDD4007141.1 Lrp/AsnC family transcriptional regulator [Sphaerochaetaceae bacterium]MDD4397051.1 Lrp/AsnC family transcriptional regulator [Sphaerochaetaceae bacterium]